MSPVCFVNYVPGLDHWEGHDLGRAAMPWKLGLRFSA